MQSFDEIKELWKQANQKDKVDYLFNALVAFREEMHNRVLMCDEKYVPKSHARIITYSVVFLAVGVAFGLGYLSLKDLFLIVPKG
jgi:hypothetical protein